MEVTAPYPGWVTCLYWADRKFRWRSQGRFGVEPLWTGRFWDINLSLFEVGQKANEMEAMSSSLRSHRVNTVLGASDTGCVNNYWNVKACHSADTELSPFKPPHQDSVILLPKGWAEFVFLDNYLIKGCIYFLNKLIWLFSMEKYLKYLIK